MNRCPGGNRTLMALPPADFESAAYTSSAILGIVREPRCRAPAKAALSRNPAPAAKRRFGSAALASAFPSPMTAVRNVLFVMCDQLRRDHVSCYGGSPVTTPNIDRLAAHGVRFDNAFVQAGVCGPARMSFYTGRYVNSHGATWNRVPLSAAEQTLGDYLRAAGRTRGARRQDARAAGHAGARALRHRRSSPSAARCCGKAASSSSTATTVTRRRGRSRVMRNGCARAATPVPIPGPTT